MAKKYVINLSAVESEQLERIARGVKGKLKIARWKVQRALVILKCDQGEDGAAWTDAKISEAFGVTVRSIENWRKQSVVRNSRVRIYSSSSATVNFSFPFCLSGHYVPDGTR